MINWDIRYAKAVAMLPELADATLTILEVGAGGGRIAEISPGNYLRMQHSQIKNKSLQRRINNFSLNIKADLMRLYLHGIPARTWQAIYKEIEASVLKAERVGMGSDAANSEQ